MQDEASELKNYYDNLQRTYKKIKKKLTTATVNNKHNIYQEMEQIDKQIKHFQEQYGNFIKAQNNNFGEFNEESFRSCIQHRKYAQEMHQFNKQKQIENRNIQNRGYYDGPHNMNQPPGFQVTPNVNEYNMKQRNDTYAPYHTKTPPSFLQNMQQNYQVSRGVIRTPAQQQFIPNKQFEVNFMQRAPRQNVSPQMQYARQPMRPSNPMPPMASPVITSPHFRVHSTPKHVSPPIRQHPVNMPKGPGQYGFYGIPQQMPQHPQYNISVKMDDSAKFIKKPEIIKSPLKLNMAPSLSTIKPTKQSPYLKSPEFRTQIDPLILVQDNLKINVNEICANAKKITSNDMRIDLLTLKKKWMLNNFKLTPRIREDLLDSCDSFLRKIMTKSISMAKGSKTRKITRKHVELAFLKTEDFLMPDSSYIPINQPPFKKHQKRLALIDESESIKKQKMM